VDRLLAAMQALGLIELTPSTAQVIVTVMDRSLMTDYQVVTRELRQSGIRSELYLGDERSLGKQLQYANRQKIPLAIIIGGDEIARGEVTIKDLELGAKMQDKKKSSSGKDRDEWLRLSRSVQRSIPRQELIATLRAMLKNRDATPELT
jgi:histidyl-tRNA synthetase